jgi:hypothetical protein
MATGFTAGTPLGSQYQYTPITFAPLLSLVPPRPAPAPAPAPTGLEATAQMPVPQYTGGQEGPGGEMQPFFGPMVGEQPFGQVMSDIGRGISMVSNPLPNLVSLITTGKTLMENMGLMFGSQQQQTAQQAPVVTLSPEAIALSQQMGIPASEAQGLIDMGIGFAANIEGQANVPGNNLGDVGFGGEPGGGPVSGEGMGAPPAEAAAGMGPGW